MMKKIKKTLCLVLALVMCLGLVNLSAFAEEPQELTLTEMIEALPETVTEENAEDVKAQLETILAALAADESGEDPLDDETMSRLNQMQADVMAVLGENESGTPDTTPEDAPVEESPSYAVARIESTGIRYATLNDAIAAAGNGDTVTLLTDVTDGSGVIVNQSVTIDFDGHSYTVTNYLAGSSGTETQAFQLLAGDKANPHSVTMKNGTIILPSTTNNLRMGIQNYTNLTLNHMILDASENSNIGYVLSNNNGTTTITGGTELKAAEGNVAFDVYDYSSNGYGKVSVTVDDAVITGGIEVSEGDKATLSISGGTFSRDVTEYCAEGYVCVKNDDTYTVELKPENGSVLTTDIGEKAFYVGESVEFSFTTEANDDAGTMVIGTSNFSDTGAIEKLEYYEVNNDTWYDFNGDFGPPQGFPMSDATSKFRVTFKTPGTHTFTASMKTVDSDETLCSTEVEFTVHENAVAAIGETTYTTLQSAINAAQNDQTVKLLRDTEVTAPYIAIQKKIISLDLNDHTVSGGYLWVYGDNAGLTVKDSSENQNGRIVGKSHGLRVSGGNGTLTVQSGTVNGNAGYGIRAQSGTVNVTGGTVNGSYYGIRAEGSAVTMTGGTVVGNQEGIFAIGPTTTVTVGEDGSEENAAIIKGNKYDGVWVRNGAALYVKDGADIYGGENGIAVAIVSNKQPDAGGGNVYMSGGKVSCGKLYGITGNGSEGTGKTVIEISGGEIIGTCTGIFHPQIDGELTVTGGTISGYTGIEMRAGTLAIPKNSTTEITGDYTIDGIHYGFGSKPNGSGTTTFGVGVAVSQHTTEKTLNVNIAGGTLQGHFALFEQDLQNDTHSDVSVLVTGGTFETISYDPYSPDPYRGPGSNSEGYNISSEGYSVPAAVKNVDRTSFISGGDFSTDVDIYCAEGYVSHETSTPAGYYNVHRPSTGWFSNASSHWQGCSVSGCLEDRTEPTAHTFGDWVTDTAAQVGVAGSRHHDCTVCGYRENGTIPALPSTGGGTTGGTGGGSTGGGGGGYLPPSTGGTTGGGSTGGTTGGTTDIEDENPPLANVGGGLNTTDHFAYIMGRGNGSVQPEANITRAEAVTIFFRLMTEEYRVANWSTSNSFTDADPAAWYNTELSTAAKAGILKGYTDGTVKPNAPITRAEFAAIAARFMSDDITDEGVGDFDDTKDMWASQDIRRAVKAGWILGKGGNLFCPNDLITRAEVMAIVNRMLDRVADKDHMLADMQVWTDNMDTSKWYYADVQEATNDHDYERQEDGVTEQWTKLAEPKDWNALEAEWIANNGASAPASEEK